jgi:capsular exopolysaccharide synthesis family protein
MDTLEKYSAQIIEPRPAPFEVPPEHHAQGTSDLIRGVLRRWYIAALVFVLMCGSGIPAIWLLIEPLYSVTGAIRVAPIIANILTGEAERGMISNYDNFVATQAKYITSPQVVQWVADSLADKNLSFFQDEPSGFVERLKRKLTNRGANPDPANMLKNAISDGVITATPPRRTELIEVTMKSTKPAEARQIVNTFISGYMVLEGGRATRDKNETFATLESEQKRLVGSLEDRRKKLRELAQQYGTTTLGGRQDMALQRVTTLLAELTRIEARKISLEAQVQFLQTTQQQTITPDVVLERRTEYVNSNPMIQELTSRIVQLEQQLIEAKQTLGPGNPALKQKEELLTAFRSRLEERKQELEKEFENVVSNEIDKANKEKLLSAQAELEQTRAHEKHLRDVLAAEDTQTIQLGRTQLNIEELQFQLSFDQQQYEQVCRRISELEMERKSPARVSVAFDADIGEIRDKRVKYSAALVFFAFASGCGLAFLRDRADKSLRTPDDVAKRIGVRVIGTTTSSQTVKPSLFAAQIAEDYQTIRANLGLLNNEGMPKKVAVTSPGMREGKTTFAINLATSLSKSGKRVLLIDGDLRKPDIGYLLNIPRGSKGLEEMLLGTEFEQVVRSVPATGLDVVVPHLRNGVDIFELIGSPTAAEQIRKLVEHYDHIIIDTPPVLAFPDALVWAKIAGAVILTSFAGQTTRPDLKEVKQRFEEINVRILGTVLGNVPLGRSYYRYGYHYYTRDGERRRKTSRTAPKLLLPMQNSKDKTSDSD